MHAAAADLPVTWLTVTSWHAEPGVVLPIAAAAGCYALGVRDAWRRAGRGRGIPRWRAACFAGGLAALVVALVSPLDAMGDALFAAHMVQHLLIIQVAAPLLVLGAPQLGMLRALPVPARRRLVAWWRRRALAERAWRAVTAPALATVLHAAALWAWHARPLYEAALASPWLHALEHSSFLITALLLWTAVLHGRRPRRTRYAVGILALFATSLHGGALGALLTFARTAWYPVHAAGAAAYALSPLADQQLAGLIMWVPGGLLYVFAAALLFVRGIDGTHRRRERAGAAPAGPALLTAPAAGD